MNKIALSAFAALAFACAPSAQATTFPVGPVGSHFYLTNGNPGTSFISANFWNSFSGGTSFDDTFLFTIPQNGVGSGSISTSFSGSNRLVITDLIINGVSYSLINEPSGQSRTVGNIPIVANVQNSIRVIGQIIGAGTYNGTATFTAVAIPEPSTWALMIAGFAVVGLAVRRRSMQVSFS